MFHTISWPQYFTLLGGAGAFYYGWIFWKWFPNERAALGAGKRKENGEGLSAPAAEAQARAAVEGAAVTGSRETAKKEEVRSMVEIPPAAGQSTKGPGPKVAMDGKLLGNGEAAGDETAGSAPATQAAAGNELGLRILANLLTGKITRRVQTAAETGEVWTEMKFGLRQLVSGANYKLLWGQDGLRKVVRDAVAAAVKEKMGKALEEEELNEIGEGTFFV